MSIVSRLDPERMRKFQQKTGESSRCFSDVSITREMWGRIVKEYGICGSPVEVDTELEEYYWENQDRTVRLITKGDPRESDKPITEITVFAR